MVSPGHLCVSVANSTNAATPVSAEPTSMLTTKAHSPLIAAAAASPPCPSLTHSRPDSIAWQLTQEVRGRFAYPLVTADVSGRSCVGHAVGTGVFVGLGLRPASVLRGMSSSSPVALTSSSSHAERGGLWKLLTLLS